jgi:hypothetical protein
MTVRMARNGRKQCRLRCDSLLATIATAEYCNREVIEFQWLCLVTSPRCKCICMFPREAASPEIGLGSNCCCFCYTSLVRSLRKIVWVFVIRDNFRDNRRRDRISTQPNAPATTRRRRSRCRSASLLEAFFGRYFCSIWAVSRRGGHSLASTNST